MPIGIIKNKANFAPSFVIVFSSICSIPLSVVVGWERL